MKDIFIAALVAAACITRADAGPFGPDHGFDVVYAAVESAPEAPSGDDPDWLAEVFEHSIDPDSTANDERSTEPRSGSDEKSPEGSHQPSNQKE